MSEREDLEGDALRLEFTAEAEAVLDVADMAVAAFSYRQVNRLPLHRNNQLYGGQTTVSREELTSFANRHRPFAARSEIALLSGPEARPKGRREQRQIVPSPPFKLIANGDYDRPLAFIYPDPKEGLSMVQVDVNGVLVANNRDHIAAITKCLEGIALRNKMEASRKTGSKIGKLAAGISAVSLLLVGGLLLSDDEESPKPTPPAALAPPAVSVPPESKPPADLPKASGPEIFLRTGRIINGGMVIEPERSRGVDCQKSYDSQTGFPVTFGELQPPLNLDVDSFLTKTGRLIIGEKKQILYVGEETADQVAGSPELSEGYAIEYEPANERYLIYQFFIKERSPKPSDPPFPGVYGDMYGRPLQQLSRADLRRGVTFGDGEKTFTARIQDSSSASATGSPLRITIQCDRPPR